MEIYRNGYSAGQGEVQESALVILKPIVLTLHLEKSLLKTLVLKLEPTLGLPGTY